MKLFFFVINYPHISWQLIIHKHTKQINTNRSASLNCDVCQEFIFMNTINRTLCWHWTTHLHDALGSSGNFAEKPNYQFVVCLKWLFLFQLKKIPTHGVGKNATSPCLELNDRKRKKNLVWRRKNPKYIHMLIYKYARLRLSLHRTTWIYPLTLSQDKDVVLCRDIPREHSVRCKTP